VKVKDVMLNEAVFDTMLKLAMGLSEIAQPYRLCLCTGRRCNDDRRCSLLNSPLCRLTSTSVETTHISTTSLWLPHLEQMPIRCL